MTNHPNHGILFVVFGQVSQEALFSLVKSVTEVCSLTKEPFQVIHLSCADFVHAMRKFEASPYSFMVYLSGAIHIDGDNLGRFLEQREEPIIYALPRRFPNKVFEEGDVPLVEGPAEENLLGTLGDEEGEEILQPTLWVHDLSFLRVSREFLEGLQTKVKDGEYGKTVRWKNLTYRGDEAVLARYRSISKKYCWLDTQVQFGLEQSLVIPANLCDHLDEGDQDESNQGEDEEESSQKEEEESKEDEDEDSE